MEKAYWLGRKRASLKSANDAINSKARLIHYDLAGRYSVKARSAETAAMDLRSSLAPAINPARSKGTGDA